MNQQGKLKKLKVYSNKINEFSHEATLYKNLLNRNTEKEALIQFAQEETPSNSLIQLPTNFVLQPISTSKEK